MSGFLAEPSAAWAVILIVVVPIAIIGIGEAEERLRQRDSPYADVVVILRRWTIPLFAIWALSRGLFGVEESRIWLRLVGTGLLLTLAAAALALTKIVVEGIVNWSREGESERGRVPQLLLALPRVGIVVVTGWLLLDGVWGVDLSAALTALGVTSLIVSFALQDTLSGLASGFLLLSDAPFQPGDWIRYGDVEGKVVDINWRSSRIENRNGDLVVVPNAQLAGATVINFDEPRRLHRVVVPVQVAFRNPPTRAKDMLLDAARSTPFVLDDPPPAVRVVQIDDPLMGYEVDLWIEDFKNAPRVFSDFGSLVWYQSHRHEVPLPSPAYDLYLYDGPQVEAASKPDIAEVLRRLRRSPLLAQLDEDDLHRLAAAGTAHRFAAGEEILGGEATKRDLHVLYEGTARIVVGEGEDVLGIIELGEGEVFGMLGTGERVRIRPRVLAVNDCELIVIEEGVAGDVTSRNPGLSAALNQLVSMRRRRIERWIQAAETPGTEEAPATTDPGGSPR